VKAVNNVQPLYERKKTLAKSTTSIRDRAQMINQTHLDLNVADIWSICAV